MPGYSDAGKAIMLDALVAQADGVATHAGDPGVDGTGTPETSTARQAPTFGSASGGEVAFGSSIDFDGDPAAGATHFSVWAGATCLGAGVNTGATEYNAEGKYRLLAGTRMHLNA